MLATFTNYFIGMNFPSFEWQFLKSTNLIRALGILFAKKKEYFSTHFKVDIQNPNEKLEIWGWKKGRDWQSGAVCCSSLEN